MRGFRDRSTFPNTLQMGSSTFMQASPIKLGARLAITIDNIGLGVYQCLLSDISGAGIIGSEFEANEISGDLYVPDGTLITVVPCKGYWGFLRRWGVIPIDGVCMVAEDDDTNHNTELDMVNIQTAGHEQRLLLHTARSFTNPTGVVVGVGNTLNFNISFEQLGGMVRTGAIWIYLIPDEFDPATVKWSTKPVCTDWVVHTDHAGTMARLGSGTVVINTGVDSTLWDNMNNTGAGMLVFSGVLPVGPFYGIEIRIIPQTIGDGCLFNTWEVTTECSTALTKIIV